MATLPDAGQLPFPQVCPEIEIIPCKGRVDPINFPELRWWFTIPRLGDHTMAAEYDALTRELIRVRDMRAMSRARVHDIDCVEIHVNQWTRDGRWSPSHFFYAREEEDSESRWLAVVSIRNGIKYLTTFLEDDFESQWGKSDSPSRSLFDDGRYERIGDYEYRVNDARGLGAGIFRVRVGELAFRCLRILEPDMNDPKGGELVEAYIDFRSGRAVLFRRYDGRFFRGEDLVEKFPTNRRLLINDQTYVHCDCTGRAHDVITSTAVNV